MRVRYLRSILILMSCIQPLSQAVALETAPPIPQPQATAAPAAGMTTPVAGAAQTGPSALAPQAQPTPAAPAIDPAHNAAGTATAGTVQAGHPAPAAVTCPPLGDLLQVHVSKVAPVAPIEPDAATTKQKDAAVKKDAAANKDGTANQKPIVQLRDAIEVTVNSLETLLKLEACSLDHRKIVLFLDRRALVDLKPYPRADPKQNVLFF